MRSHYLPSWRYLHSTWPLSRSNCRHPFKSVGNVPVESTFNFEAIWRCSKSPNIGAGCSKLFPPVSLTTNRAERCTNAPGWTRRGFNPREENGARRFGPDFDWIVLDWKKIPIRNVAKKIQSETSPRLYIHSSTIIENPRMV